MSWDIDSSRPIYSQLLERIEDKIISGEYPLGARLESVRELAEQASVNPNTMQKALMKLERNGLVITQRTAGRFITDDAEKVKKIREVAAKEQVKKFMMKMIALGLDCEEIIKLIQNYVNNR